MTTEARLDIAEEESGRRNFRGNFSIEAIDMKLMQRNV